MLIEYKITYGYRRVTVTQRIEPSPCGETSGMSTQGTETAISRSLGSSYFEPLGKGGGGMDKVGPGGGGTDKVGPGGGGMNPVGPGGSGVYDIGPGGGGGMDDIGPGGGGGMDDIGPGGGGGMDDIGPGGGFGAGKDRSLFLDLSLCGFELIAIPVRHASVSDWIVKQNVEKLIRTAGAVCGLLPVRTRRTKERVSYRRTVAR